MTVLEAPNFEREAEIYRDYHPRVFRYLNRFVSDPMQAEDLAQESLLVTIRKFRRCELADTNRLYGFVCRVAKNLWIGQMRRRDSQRLLLSGAEIESFAAEHVDTAQQEFQFRTTFENLIAELEVERDKDLLGRYYLYEQSKLEICEALNLSPPHFDRVLSRARKRLQKKIRQSAQSKSLNYSEFISSL